MTPADDARDDGAAARREQRLRRSRLCAGLAVVLLVLLFETVVAHRRLPSPASPYVWAGLGLGAGLCAVLAAWYRWRP